MLMDASTLLVADEQRSLQVLSGPFVITEYTFHGQFRQHHTILWKESSA